MYDVHSEQNFGQQTRVASDEASIRPYAAPGFLQIGLLWKETSYALLDGQASISTDTKLDLGKPGKQM